MRSNVIKIVAVMLILGVTNAAQALVLRDNQDVGDGVLTGTNSAGVVENIRTNVANRTLFWWADTNGDNTVGDPASPGLNLAKYNLTRQADAIGITLDLNDGTSDRAITWTSGTNGKITTDRDGNGNPNGPITIRGVTDITCEGLYTHRGASANAGNVAVTQSGNFSAANVWTYQYYGNSYSGNILFTGGGPAAGTFSVSGMIESSGRAFGSGSININGYSAVTVGSGGISCYNSGAHDGKLVTITNIGVGGVSVAGDIDHRTRGANSSSYTQPNHVTISTAGNVQLAGVKTYQSRTDEWMYTDVGTIRITAGGSVTATGAMETYTGATFDDQLRNSGAVIIQAGGTVRLAGIDTHLTRNNSSRYAGDVTVTAGGDVAITGPINLFAGSGGNRRGDLVLTNNSRGSITVNSLNMSNLNIAAFNSGVGWSQITNVLAYFTTNYVGGSGTLASPFVATQKQLRLPAGQRIYYSSPGGTNDYLGGYVYQLTNLTATGVGGLLMMRVAGAPEIYNVGASNVQATSADLVANLTTGDAPVTVTCYWGTNDAGAVASAWMTNRSQEVSTWGYVTNAVADLETSKAYYFRFFASNAVGTVWASDTMTFSTVGPPTVDNGDGPASVTQTSALLQGRKLSGDPTTQVWIYWGTADGETNKNDWNKGSLYIGTPEIGAFSQAVGGLPANQTNWYRCFISNSYGIGWAPASTNFTTKTPAMVINSVGLLEGALGTTNTAVFTVTLSPTSALPVTVDYATANNTATVANNDYEAKSGTLTIPANTSAGTISVSVIGDLRIERDETFYVNLSNPVNATTNPANWGTCTITNDDWTIYVRGDGGGSDANGGTSWTDALASLTNAVARVLPPTVTRQTIPALADVLALSTPTRIMAQASAPGQAYDAVASGTGPLDLDLQGGWENVTDTPAQIGTSVVKDLDGTVDEAGIYLTGNTHYLWRRLNVNRFAFTNVTRGIAIDVSPGTDRADSLLAVSNGTIHAKNDGIYLRYVHDYAAAGWGGLARLTAGNVDIVAGQGGFGHGISISGSWQGSSLTASGTNAATGVPRVSTITSATGDGVRLSARNTEVPDVSFAKTAIYNCATNGVHLDAAIQSQYVGSGSNAVRAAFVNCTIAGNGVDGVHTLSSVATPSWVAPTNSIFANNSGRGINMDGNVGVVACLENYNVFFNSGNDIFTNGVAQALSGTSVAANPMFYGKGALPSPWYTLGSRLSPAFMTAADNTSNRGAYQNVPPQNGTMLLLF